jgi:hypothetical protein
VLTSLPSGEYPTTELDVPTDVVITYRHGPHRKHRSFVAVQLLLRICYLAEDVVSLLVSQPLPSNGSPRPTACYQLRAHYYIKTQYARSNTPYLTNEQRSTSVLPYVTRLVSVEPHLSVVVRLSPGTAMHYTPVAHGSCQ